MEISLDIPRGSTLDSLSLALVRRLVQVDAAVRLRNAFGRSGRITLITPRPEEFDSAELVGPLRLLQQPAVADAHPAEASIRFGSGPGGGPDQVDVGSVEVAHVGTTWGEVRAAGHSEDVVRGGLLASGTAPRLLAGALVGGYRRLAHALVSSSIDFDRLEPADHGEILFRVSGFSAGVEQVVERLEEHLRRGEIHRPLRHVIDQHAVPLERFAPHEVAEDLDVRRWRIAIRDALLPARAGDVVTAVELPLHKNDTAIGPGATSVAVRVLLDNHPVVMLRVQPEVAEDKGMVRALALTHPVVRARLVDRQLVRTIHRPPRILAFVSRPAARGGDEP
jgi:hypothetical protein